MLVASRYLSASKISHLFAGRYKPDSYCRSLTSSGIILGAYLAGFMCVTNPFFSDGVVHLKQSGLTLAF